MSPVLLAGIVVSGAFWGLVELYYRFEHKPRMREANEDLSSIFGVPEEWVTTLVQIRGLPDNKRDLVFDWQVGEWEEG